MPSGKCKSIKAKATGLIFSLFDVASAHQVPFDITYHSWYNIFFMDLPVSSFVCHSSLLAAKSVDLTVTCDGFWKSSVVFIVAGLIAKMLFEQFLIRTTV